MRAGANHAMIEFDHFGLMPLGFNSKFISSCLCGVSSVNSIISVTSAGTLSARALAAGVVPLRRRPLSCQTANLTDAPTTSARQGSVARDDEAAPCPMLLVTNARAHQSNHQLFTVLKVENTCLGDE